MPFASFYQASMRNLGYLKFRYYSSKRSFVLLNCAPRLQLKENIQSILEFQPSVCNAGLVSVDDAYVSVARNQQFSFCSEMNRARRQAARDIRIDDGVRALYRIDISKKFDVLGVQRIHVFEAGKRVDPAIFVDDVRLIKWHSEIMVSVNGRGSWPMLGRLRGINLEVFPVVADFQPPQKNWMPFGFDGKLYLEYSVSPRVILAVDLETMNCEEVFRCSCDVSVPSITHGGAPAVRLNDRFFLGVANSQFLYWFQDRYYAAVFYLFEAVPPFKVVRATPPIRLGSFVPRIQYVSGMVIEDGNSVLLSIGLSDCDNVYVSFELEDVLSLMH